MQLAAPGALHARCAFLAGNCTRLNSAAGCALCCGQRIVDHAAFTALLLKALINLGDAPLHRC